MILLITCKSLERSRIKKKTMQLDVTSLDTTKRDEVVISIYKFPRRVKPFIKLTFAEMKREFHSDSFYFQSNSK